MTVVAVDGPGGSGKSTVSAALASRLGFSRLDTGAMYRAVTLVALRRGVATSDEEALAAIAEQLRIDLDGPVIVDGEDVTEAIRTHEVDIAVSAVSAQPAVRRALVARQRAWIAAHKDSVVEGRDIGTVVVPDADLKVFLTARPEVRARRRAADRQRQAAEVAAVRRAIERRDEHDSRRAVSPLLAAPEALVIDSSERTVDSVVDEVLAALGHRAETSYVPSGAPREEGPRPISWRTRWFYAACRALTVGLSRLLLPGKVIGREHVPKTGGFIFAPLHRSDIDFLIVARITRRRLRYLTKSGVFVFGPFNWLIETLGAFPVDRAVTDRRAFDRSLSVLEAGEPLVLFPEGTRNVGPSVGQMQDGAAYLALRAGVPIVPVGLAGTGRALPRGKVLMRPGRIAVVVGAPLTAGVELARSGAASRVPRPRVHALTVELKDAIQRLSDEAAGRLARGSVGRPAD